MTKHGIKDQLCLMQNSLMSMCSIRLYWQRYCTARQQQASAKLCSVVQVMELRNFRRGSTYIRQGDHHVAHRPTFLLWSPYGIGQTIIFSCCGLFFLSSTFFPRLISAATDWMSTILRHMLWS